MHIDKYLKQNWRNSSFCKDSRRCFFSDFLYCFHCYYFYLKSKQITKSIVSINVAYSILLKMEKLLKYDFSTVAAIKGISKTLTNNMVNQKACSTSWVTLGSQ